MNLADFITLGELQSAVISAMATAPATWAFCQSTIVKHNEARIAELVMRLEAKETECTAEKKAITEEFEKRAKLQQAFYEETVGRFEESIRLLQDRVDKLQALAIKKSN